MTTAGERYAEAFAKKDADAMRAVLAADVDVRALTPRRFWEPSSVDEFIDEVVLGTWFEDKDEIVGLESVETGMAGDRHRVAYSVRVDNPDGAWVVEQQAYYDVVDDRISYLRILCSGYRPVSA